MKLLDRYIAKIILSSIALVVSVLIGMQLFILVVNQADSLGKGDYGLIQAMLFVLLQTPYHVYLFFPMASLIGALIGLGVMANNRELIVMRASGMSMLKIARAVLKVALVLILSVTLLGETMIPLWVKWSNAQRVVAMSQGKVRKTMQGVWIRQAHDLIRIGEVMSPQALQDIFQFHFDHRFHWKFIRHYAALNFSQGQWQGQQMEETRLYSDHTVSYTRQQQPWEIKLNPDLLNASNQPEEMTLYALLHYVNALTHNHQSARHYQLMIWQRIIQPVSTLIMMLLAIPFIFGPLRSSTMGVKIMLGVLVGFSFYILNRFFGALGLIMPLPPGMLPLGVLVACPMLCFATLGLYLGKGYYRL